LAAARGQGLDIAEVLAGSDRLQAAEAAFMTNAAEGVTAISTVNGAVMDPYHPLVSRLRAIEAAAP
jgi:branched-subunit amino acid aminotransferase/4-amino-4-deoxychorismate lyase